MNCPKCGVSFSPRDYRQNFCSRECQLRSRDRSNGLLRRKGTGSVVYARGRIYFRIGIEQLRKEEARYRAIARYALGRQLPVASEVHHNDGSSINDMPSNLAICLTRDAHLLLEAYTRVRQAGFHALPTRPDIPNVIWVADLLDDTEDIYDVVLVWWTKNVQGPSTTTANEGELHD